MQSREIKFRLRGRNNEIIGYEMFHISFGWHHVLKSELDLLGGEAPIHSGVYKEGIEICFRDEYTGLKDVNGVEIHEGDILKRIVTVNKYNKVESLDVVEFVPGHFITRNISESEDKGTYLANFHWHTIEVIGNIHQNPDLCK